MLCTIERRRHEIISSLYSPSSRFPLPTTSDKRLFRFGFQKAYPQYSLSALFSLCLSVSFYLLFPFYYNLKVRYRSTRSKRITCTTFGVGYFVVAATVWVWLTFFFFRRPFAQQLSRAWFLPVIVSPVAAATVPHVIAYRGFSHTTTHRSPVTLTTCPLPSPPLPIFWYSHYRSAVLVPASPFLLSSHLYACQLLRTFLQIKSFSFRDMLLYCLHSRCPTRFCLLRYNPVKCIYLIVFH